MYVNIYGNERFPYDYQRKTLLSAIFCNNMELSDEVDPFAYKDDIYDAFLEEYGTLLMGGANAKKHAEEAIEQLQTIKEEFEDDDRIPDMCDDLIDDYEMYIAYFVNREEVA